ncbi:MAG: Flp family type IVb pilin [Alphaproteobacteria bacterium]
MTKLIARYISDEGGATAVEYGLIGASIAVAVAVVAFIIGGEIDGTFDTILTNLTT